jgi:hypothetical protein
MHMKWIGSIACHRRRIFSIALLLTLLATGCGTGISKLTGRAASGCSRFASPAGSDRARLLRLRQRRGLGEPGSITNPFATPARLLSSLRPGQTGCLLRGTYSSPGRLAIARSGRDGAPITLEGYPGETVRLRYGIVHLFSNADYVTLKALDIDGSDNPGVTVWIEGQHDTLQADWIHNSNRGMSCIFLDDYVAATIADNRIYDCGRYSDGNQDQAIYADETNGLQITGNMIWNTAGFAVQLFPSSRNAVITHNIIDSNGGGVIFGGTGGSASSDNLVADNVISNSRFEYLIQSTWGGRIGTGNVAIDNCLHGGALGNIELPPVGFRVSGNISADPGYSARARHDYRLGRSSRCAALLG